MVTEIVGGVYTGSGSETLFTRHDVCVATVSSLFWHPITQQYRLDTSAPRRWKILVPARCKRERDDDENQEGKYDIEQYLV